jgi:hypothetical protein
MGNIASNAMGYRHDYQSDSFIFTPDGSGNWVVGLGDMLNLSTYNWMELYLMGLARADEVPTYFVLKNQGLLQSGQVVAASDVTLVDLPSVIGVVGVRTPDWNSATTQIRVATIVLSEGQLLDHKALSVFDYLTRRGEATTVQPCRNADRCNPWFLATKGRSTMVTRIR